jgi:glycosyltransferase involved in cell wall biosynthesis
MRHITILTPCYNEVENVVPWFEATQNVMSEIKEVTYSHLFIDNASTDGTQEKLRKLAVKNQHLQVIINNRNFGHIRSPWHGLLQAKGDAVIVIPCDFQDPPEIIPVFIRYWLEGVPVVIGVKEKSDETIFFRAIRTLYYRLAKKLADVDLIEHFNGFGLYDRQVIEQMRQIPDVYPYLRGLLVELGYETVKVPYNQQKRRDGSSNNNFYTLFDMAMLGITSHSRVPLRLATLSGFLLSGISMVIASVYLILKAVYWDTFSFGLAPVIIGVFFFGAVQLFFIGVLGEYIQIIHTQIMCRPPVVEKERINLPVRLI